MVKPGRCYGVLKNGKARGGPLNYPDPLWMCLKCSIIKTKGRKEAQGRVRSQVGGRASSRSDRGVVLVLMFVRKVFRVFLMRECISIIHGQMIVGKLRFGAHRKICKNKQNKENIPGDEKECWHPPLATPKHARTSKLGWSSVE